MKYDIIVIGTSAGGIDAMKILFEHMNKKIQQPILIVQHLEPRSHSYLAAIIEEVASKKCLETEDKAIIEEGMIYVPVPNYHMVMEKNWTLSLTVEKRVSYARPSIDVLFESVSDAVKEKVIGVVLTGANSDGAKGLAKIKENGGYTLVQRPETAYATEMPTRAIELVQPDDVMDLSALAQRINALCEL